MGYREWKENINSEGNNTKRESGRNRSKFLKLKCKHNGKKRAINIRIETGYEGKKTRKNSTLNKIEAYFSPMETEAVQGWGRAPQS